MDWQYLINAGLGIILASGGWFARQLWEAVQKLKDDVSNLQLHVSDNYVKKVDVGTLKSELNVRFDRLEMLIDKVYDKLDKKADK